MNRRKFFRFGAGATAAGALAATGCKDDAVSHADDAVSHTPEYLRVRALLRRESEWVQNHLGGYTFDWAGPRFN